MTRIYTARISGCVSNSGNRETEQRCGDGTRRLAGIRDIGYSQHRIMATDWTWLQASVHTLVVGLSSVGAKRPYYGQNVHSMDDFDPYYGPPTHTMARVSHSMARSIHILWAGIMSEP